MYLIMRITGMEGSIKKLSRISLKIVIQCCAYLNNDKMRQVVGLCKYMYMYNDDFNVGLRSTIAGRMMTLKQLPRHGTIYTTMYMYIYRHMIFSLPLVDVFIHLIHCRV